jgi:hypothetical protein
MLPSPLRVRNGHRSLWVERSKKDSVAPPIRPGDGLPVHTWPFALFRTHALNDRSWSKNGHRAAQAQNPSVAFDPKETLQAADYRSAKGSFACDVRCPDDWTPFLARQRARARTQLALPV